MSTTSKLQRSIIESSYFCRFITNDKGFVFNKPNVRLGSLRRSKTSLVFTPDINGVVSFIDTPPDPAVHSFNVTVSGQPINLKDTLDEFFEDYVSGIFTMTFKDNEHAKNQ